MKWKTEQQDVNGKLGTDVSKVHSKRIKLSNQGLNGNAWETGANEAKRLKVSSVSDMCTKGLKTFLVMKERY